MKYKRTKVEEYEGVGRIWNDGTGWYWRTIYGKQGGPMDKNQAMTRMELSWASHNKDVAGIENGHKQTQKEVQWWEAKAELLRVPWR